MSEILISRTKRLQKKKRKCLPHKEATGLESYGLNFRELTKECAPPNIAQCIMNVQIGRSGLQDLQKASRYNIIKEISNSHLCNDVIISRKRITCLKWHPKNSKLCAIGSKNGGIYLLNCADPYVHERNILYKTAWGDSVLNIAFNPQREEEVYASSMNGTIGIRNFNNQDYMLLTDLNSRYITRILLSVGEFIALTPPAWDHVGRETLIKSWINVVACVCYLPENRIEEEQIISVEDFIDIFKNIDDCSDDEDINNDGGYKLNTEEDIVSCSVTENKSEEYSDSECVDELAVVLTHAQAVANRDIGSLFRVKPKHWYRRGYAGAALVDNSVWGTGLDVDFSGRSMAVGDRNGFLTLISLDDEKVQCFKQVHKSEINHVAYFNRDERFLVTASTDCTVKIWDTRFISDQKSDQNELAVLQHRCPVHSACFSESGSGRLLTTDHCYELRVYKSPLWNLERTIHQPHQHNYCMHPIKATWHTLEDIIVVGHCPEEHLQQEGKSVDFFLADSGKCVYRMINPNISSFLNLNIFNSNGEMLASVMDCSVLLWRVHSPKEDI